MYPPDFVYIPRPKAASDFTTGTIAQAPFRSFPLCTRSALFSSSGVVCVIICVLVRLVDSHYHLSLGIVHRLY